MRRVYELASAGLAGGAIVAAAIFGAEHIGDTDPPVQSYAASMGAVGHMAARAFAAYGGRHGVLNTPTVDHEAVEVTVEHGFAAGKKAPINGVEIVKYVHVGDAPRPAILYDLRIDRNTAGTYDASCTDLYVRNNAADEGHGFAEAGQKEVAGTADDPYRDYYSPGRADAILSDNIRVADRVLRYFIAGAEDPSRLTDPITFRDPCAPVAQGDLSIYKWPQSSHQQSR